MKPHVIFSAVATISILMAVILPQVANPAPAMAAPAAIELPVESLAAEAPQPAEAEQHANDPALKISAAAAEEQAAAPEELAAAPEEQAAAVEEQAAVEQPANEQPVEVPAVEPTPTEPPAAVASIARTAANLAENPQLQEFAETVATGRSGSLAGVYVAGLFALPVVEQPGGDENFVSADGDVLTRYATPGQFGVTALLAHNYLSGHLFFQLKQGQEIVLVYGDGKVSRFRVRTIEHYQALSPNDVRSDFRDLNGPGGQILSFSQLFDRVYKGNNTVVFQTCIEANGDPSWGRIFIIADPLI